MQKKKRWKEGSREGRKERRRLNKTTGKYCSVAFTLMVTVRISSMTTDSKN